MGISDPEYLARRAAQIRITYHQEADALYIRLLEDECRTLRLTDDVALNIGPDEVLVGIEVLDAKHTLGNGELPSVIIENLPESRAA